MKRFLTTAAACLSLAPPASTASPYGWTISASSTDPLVNQLPATGDLQNVYLWLWYTTAPVTGMSAAQMALDATGVVVVDVTMLNAFLNAGDNECLLIATGCPGGPLTVARITIEAHEGSLCLDGCGFYPEPVTVNCLDPLMVWEIDWIGLDVGDGPCASPISVEPESWGRLKALYR